MNDFDQPHSSNRIHNTYFGIWLQGQPAWTVHFDVQSIAIFLSTESWNWFTKICLTAGNRFRVWKVHLKANVMRRGACLSVNHTHTTLSSQTCCKTFYIYFSVNQNSFRSIRQSHGSLSAKLRIFKCSFHTTGPAVDHSRDRGRVSGIPGVGCCSFRMICQ